MGAGCINPNTYSYTRETHMHTTHTLFQIRSIMPHDSTRGCSSTISSQTGAWIWPSFPQFPIYSLSDKEQNSLWALGSSVWRAELPSASISSNYCHWKAALERNGWKQQLQVFSRRIPLTSQRWLRCLRGRLCAELLPLWLEFNFLSCNA